MTMRAEISGRVPAIQKVGKPCQPIPLGLTTAERDELEWYFCWYEADIGITSTFGAMVNAIAAAPGDEGAFEVKVRSAGGAPQSDERLLRLHFDKGRPLDRASCVYRALRAMSAGHGLEVTVLWLLHGPPRPSPLHAVFGDVAPIVHLTRMVEGIREQMSAEDGEVRYERVSEEYAAALEEQRVRIAHDFWDAAGEWQRLEARLAHRRGNPRMAGPRGAAITYELGRRAEAWRAVMRTLLSASAYDGTASAQATAMGAADRELTPQAAIRWMLEYAGPRDKDGKPLAEPHKVHLEARKAFVRAARLEAERMRIGASIAYRAARKASGS